MIDASFCNYHSVSILLCNVSGRWLYLPLYKVPVPWQVASDNTVLLIHSYRAVHLFNLDFIHYILAGCGEGVEWTQETSPSSTVTSLVVSWKHTAAGVTWPLRMNKESWSCHCRSQWPRGLRRRSFAARLLRLWVRIPPGTWIFVCCECCVLWGRGLCDGLIIRSEESYRMWRVVVCDQETS